MKGKKASWIILGLVFLVVISLVVFWPRPAVDPAQEDPVVEDPVVEDPVVEDPVVEDPVPKVPVEEMVFSEAPMLAAKVADGDLPPVEERLPLPEYVKIIEPVEEIGTYGGTWRTVHPGPGFWSLRTILTHPGVKWKADMSGVEPGAFKGWEFNEDGTSVTIFLRRGMRWSDGARFTTEDFRFWWEYLAGDPEFGDIGIPGWAYRDGELMTVDFIDDYTMRFNFVAPYWILPDMLSHPFFWMDMNHPKHYLVQYHPRHNPELEGDYTLLGEKIDRGTNVDLPTIWPWDLVELIPGERAVFERNPFFWQVDTAGNQLPYIDRIVSLEVPDDEVRILKFLAGDIDATFREVTHSARNLPVMMDGAEAAGMRYMPGWLDDAGGWPLVVINQDFIGDDYLRKLFRDRNFRRGLNLAIDRSYYNEVIFHGLAREQQATLSYHAPIFKPPGGRELYNEWIRHYAEYDVERANQYLDEAGLDARDPETGFRLRADNGEVLEVLIDIGAWGGREINELTSGMLKDSFEAVGIKTVLNFAPDPEIDHRWMESLFMMRILHLAHMTPLTGPNWFVVGEGIRAWPMNTRYLVTGGKEGEPFTPFTAAVREVYESILAEPDAEKRNIMWWDVIRLHMEEGPIYIGILGGQPGMVFLKENFSNVFEYGSLGDWHLGAPANVNTAQFFFRVE